MKFPILSLITFTPLVAMIVVLLLPKSMRNGYKWISLAATFVQLILAVLIFIDFRKHLGLFAGVNDPTKFAYQEVHNWISVYLGSYGWLDIKYFMAVDGISVTMVLLTALVCFTGVICSWNIEKYTKGYFALYLLLDMAMVGVFCALDFFLFYIFWEVMLLPMYFLIGIWGGPRREYAAIKFFLYTLVGSVFMLLVVVGLYFSVVSNPEEVAKSGMSVAQHSFNMLEMMNPKNYLPGSIFEVGGAGATLFGVNARLIAFMALFIGFAIKVPMVPFHTWLPDAHVEAPTPISVILAGVLLKMGGYGIFRICYGIFPEGGIHFSYFIAFMGMVSIIYGAFVAMAQTDLKKLIAYSSVSHMGYVLLGLASLTPEGMNGAMFQMFNHGTISAMLFMLVGVIYDRVHDRMIPNFRGLANHMPIYTGMVMLAFFASLGLPGMSGFVSEALVFIGGFNSETQYAGQIFHGIPRWITILSTSGILLTAAYYLWTMQRMFFGSLWVKEEHWKHELVEINNRELAMLIPLAVVTIYLGIMPNHLLDLMSTSIKDLMAYTAAKGPEYLDAFYKTLGALK